MVSTSLASIPVVLVLAYVPHFLKGLLYLATTGKYNNLMPRSQWDNSNPNLAKSPFSRLILRANYAHLNGMENFPGWAAAVLAAHVRGVDEDTLAPLATAYMVSRALYNVVYILGVSPAIAMVRSMLWFGGFVLTLYVMWLAC